MPFSRRTMMTVLGGIVLGYGTAASAGAFDRIQLEREVSFEVADDDETSMLTLAENQTRDEDELLEVEVSEDGLISLVIDEPGLAREATTEFHDVLYVHNFHNYEVGIEVEFLLGDGSTTDLVVAFDGSNPSKTDFDPIPVGGYQSLGFLFETDDWDEVESVSSIQIEAMRV